MNFLKKIGAGYLQLKDDFLLKKILKDIKPNDPSSSKILFVFSQVSGGYYLKLFVLFAHALSKMGYSNTFLFEDHLTGRYINKRMFISDYVKSSKFFFTKGFKIETYFPKLIIDGEELSNSLIEEKPKIKIINRKDKKLKYNWDIDLKKKTIKVHNIDFFSLIENTLRTHLKRYNIDFSDEKIISKTKEMIKSCDLLVYYFFQMKKYAKKNKIKIKIIGWEQIYVPNGVFRILCDKLSENRDIEYIGLARGYGRYFGYHRHESNIVTSNLTRSHLKNKLVVKKEEMKELKIKYDDITALSEIKKIIKEPSLRNRENQEEIIKLMKKYKSQKKPVFTLLTHLFYDTDIDDTSNSFEDMCDWVKVTVDFFKGKDKLLLLKPHPSEQIPNEPERQPNETLKSYIQNQKIILPENVILLEPRQFGLNEIVNFIDCGLIWRSSASMELPYYNKPAIISGNPAYKDTLDFYYAKNRKDYFDKIENVDKLKLNKNLKLDCARYLLGLRDKHKYIQCLAYDRKINRNYFEKELLEKYLTDGDKNIDFLVNEMLK